MPSVMNAPASGYSRSRMPPPPWPRVVFHKWNDMSAFVVRPTSKNAPSWLMKSPLLLAASANGCKLGWLATNLCKGWRGGWGQREREPQRESEGEEKSFNHRQQVATAAEARQATRRGNHRRHTDWMQGPAQSTLVGVQRLQWRPAWLPRCYPSSTSSAHKTKDVTVPKQHPPPHMTATQRRPAQPLLRPCIKAMLCTGRWRSRTMWRPPIDDRVGHRRRNMFVGRSLSFRQQVFAPYLDPLRFVFPATGASLHPFVCVFPGVYCVPLLSLPSAGSNGLSPAAAAGVLSPSSS